MKRTLLLVAAVGATTLSLAACGAGESNTASGGSSSTGGTQPTIAFIQGVAGDEFYVSMRCGVESEAAKLGAQVTVQGPEKFDPSLQRPIVDSVVSSKPDAILIAPTDVAAMQAPLEAAAKQGIKIVLVDTTLKDPSIAVSSIASDNQGGGAQAFKALQELAPQGGKILAIATDPGVSTIDQRMKGFEDAAKADSKYTYLGVQYSHNEPAQAAQLITAALQKDPDIVGVFAANTFSAEGTATGLRQAGKQDQVKIVGFDAGPAQVKQLKEGTVQALIAQQPETIGTDGVEQAMNAIQGKPVEKTIQTDSAMITKDNVDTDGAKYTYKSSC